MLKMVKIDIVDLNSILLVSAERMT